MKANSTEKIGKRAFYTSGFIAKSTPGISEAHASLVTNKKTAYPPELFFPAA